MFKLNSNINLGGSALQRFFGRDVGTYQPTLMRKKLDHAALIQKRSDHQMKVAKKLGRRSVDEFKIGDLVVAQNMRTSKWTIRGKVVEGRMAEDGTTRSFVVETEEGKTTLRNSCHLKHQTRKKNVRFTADDGYGTDEEASLQTDISDMVTSEVRGPDRVSARLAALRLAKARL